MQKEQVFDGRGAASAVSQPEVLVIGLGNPILGDDGVGWKVAQRLSAQLPAPGRVEVDCLAVGGLGLMERMLGYRHVILVDSMITGAQREGHVMALRLDELADSSLGHSASAHDASLCTALETARAMGASPPERVDIVSIEARDCFDFSEVLSPLVAAAVPVATETVLRLIGHQE